MKNLFYFITAAALLFSAAAFVSPYASTSKRAIIVPAKSFTITGKVTDESGEALIGASILEKGTTNGTITDFDGQYSLKVTREKATLVISYTGFSTQEIHLGKSNVVDVVLQQGITLDACVVTAMGVRKEARSVGYASVPKRNKKSRKKEGAYQDALSGRVAGVKAAPQRAKIRGSRSETTDHYVDGVKGKANHKTAPKPSEPAEVRAYKQQAGTTGAISSPTHFKTS